MNPVRAIVLACALLFLACPAFAGETEELKQMLQAMQQKIQALETKIDDLEKKESERAVAESEAATKTQAAATDENVFSKTLKEAKADLGELKNTFDTRFGKFTIHGNFIGYVQGDNAVDIAGIYYPENAGAGFSTNLMINWIPVEDTELYFQLQYANGLGPDKDLRNNNAILARLNKITTDPDPNNPSVVLKYAMLTQYLYDRKLFFSLGKADQETYIDQNVYAGDAYSQFLGMPFNKDPVLDIEDDQTPMFAVGYNPTPEFGVTAMFNSSSTALAAPQNKKNGFDDIFMTPFLGGEVTWSPKFDGRQGNYRFYGWTQTYPHPVLTNNPNETGDQPGYAFGVSFDQEVSDMVGLFMRGGYHNEAVYTMPWTVAYGASLKGLIPGRDDDVLGLGIAQVWSNPTIYTGGIEHHFEAYYRYAFNQYFAVAPDFQAVVQPQGDSGNPAVLSGAIRGEFHF